MWRCGDVSDLHFQVVYSVYHMSERQEYTKMEIPANSDFAFDIVAALRANDSYFGYLIGWDKRCVCDKHDKRKCKRKRNDKETKKNAQRTHSNRSIGFEFEYTRSLHGVRANDFRFFLCAFFFQKILLAKNISEKKLDLNTNRINYYPSSQCLFMEYKKKPLILLPSAIRFAYRYAFIKNKIRWIDRRSYIFDDVCYFYLRLTVVLALHSIPLRYSGRFGLLRFNLPSTLFIVW